MPYRPINFRSTIVKLYFTKKETDKDPEKEENNYKDTSDIDQLDEQI